ncbi:hypothetical protein AGMMS50229_16760 [Campylobacterota bacterium]|nr:hypothetical protein AGMMS50229_16760 [Campylobacterota bacterium]
MIKNSALITMLFTIGLLFGGCAYINECGVSSSYYNDCVEGYDAQGVYFKKCPYNNISNKCEQKDEFQLEDCLNCN